MGTELVVDRTNDGDLQIIEIRGVLDAGNVEQLAHVGFEAICESFWAALCRFLHFGLT